MAVVSNSTLLVLGPNAWILLAVMLALAGFVWRATLRRPPVQMLVAGVRALVQLAAVALVIAWLSDRGAWAFVFVALMLLVGVWTSGGRVAGVQCAGDYRRPGPADRRRHVHRDAERAAHPR